MITRGLILDKDVDKLIVQATDDQVERFVVGERVKVRAVTHPTVPASGGNHYFGGAGTVIYGSADALTAWPNFTSEQLALTGSQIRAAIDADPNVYDRHGRRLGSVHAWSTERNMLDVTTFGSSAPEFISGAERVSISVVGP